MFCITHGLPRLSTVLPWDNWASGVVRITPAVLDNPFDTVWIRTAEEACVVDTPLFQYDDVTNSPI